MHDRQPLKARAEPLHRLSGQRNLRQQNHGLSTQRQRLLNRPNINFRLAAVGHSMQERHGKPAFFQLFVQMLQCLFLLRGQHDGLLIQRQPLRHNRQRTHLNPLAAFDLSLPKQFFQRSLCTARLLEQGCFFHGCAFLERPRLPKRLRNSTLSPTSEGVGVKLLVGQIKINLLSHAGIFFHRCRHHSRQHLPQRTNIILTHPSPQLHQRLIQQRLCIQNPPHCLQRKRPRFLPAVFRMFFWLWFGFYNKPFHQFIAFAEGNLHPLAGGGPAQPFGNQIIKQRIGPAVESHTNHLSCRRQRLLTRFFKQTCGLMLAHPAQFTTKSPPTVEPSSFAFRSHPPQQRQSRSAALF